MTDVFTPAHTYQLAGITRGEAQTWLRNGWLNIPPANPGHGGARRYSRANVIEMALFKTLVSEGYVRIPHVVAKRVLKRRLEVALAGGPVRENENPISRPERLNKPGALADTEFDLETHRRLEPHVKGRGFRHELWIISNDDQKGDEAGAVGGLIVSTADNREAWVLDMAVAHNEYVGKIIVFSLTRALKGVAERAKLAGIKWRDDDAGWTGR